MILLPIPDFEGYFAGDDGNIYSNRLKTQPYRKLKGHI